MQTNLIGRKCWDDDGISEIVLIDRCSDDRYAAVIVDRNGSVSIVDVESLSLVMDD